MKTFQSKFGAVLFASAFMTIAAIEAPADQADAAKPEKTYTGTVVSVEAQERVLKAKGLFLTRKFNLGASCACTQLDNKTGTITDLRPGEKVTIHYQDANGVLIASGIVQQPMRYEGMVEAIDPAAHTLTLHLAGLNKTFQLPDDCAIVLRNDKPGTLADIQTGNHAAVTYETPDGKLTAREIAQTSLEFTGTLTAIDLEDKTLKAKSLFGSRKFNVADGCAIVVNERPNGRLSDLKPDDKLVFSYDEINGVNVVNRIAPVASMTNRVASVPPPATGH